MNQKTEKRVVGKRYAIKGCPGIYSRVQASGRVVYDVVWREGDGKQRSRICRSLKEARALKDEVSHGLRTGSYVPPTTVTFGDFIQRRLEHRFAVNAIRESTFDSDQRLLNLHLPDALANMPIQKVTTAHLNDLYSQLTGGGRMDGRPGGLSPRTIDRLHNLLSQSLKEARRQGLVVQNVAEATTRPRMPKKQVVVMTAQEVRQMLEGAKEDWFFALYFLGVTTGMRRGELCGLTWDCVDFEHAEIHIKKSLGSVGAKPAWSMAKTDSGLRTIPLDPKSVDVLRDQKRRLAEAQLLLGPAWRNTENLVFPKEDGSIYNPNNVYDRFKRLLKRVGLPPNSIHNLRHTYATLARRQGMDIKVLSERLGHSTIVVTMNLYQHVPQDLAKQAAHDVADYILGSSRK